MRKILFLIILISFINFVYAADVSQEKLGVFKFGEDIELIQTCSNGTALCDSCNLTSVKYPNSSILVSDKVMTKRASDFNYTIYSGTIIANGEYIVNGFCRSGNEYKVWTYTFEVTPMGFKNTLGFYIIILSISTLIMVLGFWKKDGWTVIFGTIGLYLIGLFIMLYGIDGFRDRETTFGISLIILGLAGYISIRSSWEMITM